MPEPKKWTLLWIDDGITELGAYVSALEKRGFEVDTASSCQEALEKAKNKQYDIILVDIMMPPPDGIEILRKLVRIQHEAAFAAFSSYLYLETYKEQLRALSFKPQLIDKDLPNVNSDDFEWRFILPIRELAEHGVRYTIETEDKVLEKEVGVNPFEIPLVSFIRKPLAEKEILVKKAKFLAEDTIDKAFREGNVWVLLCGSPDRIVASASYPSEILTEEQVIEYAKTQGRAPFQFFGPVHSDDMWCSSGQSRQLKNYPTVTLRVKDENLTSHFDTGSPQTYFSYEKLLSIGAITPTTNFVMGLRGEQIYWGIYLNIEVLLESQISGQTKIVRLIGQAIRNWKEGPFARNCNEDCPAGISAKTKERFVSQLCPFRIGLVGRNLIIDNKLIFVLDGVNRKTGFEGK